MQIQIEKLEKVVKGRLRAVLYVPARTISDLSLPHPQILRRAIEIVQHQNCESFASLDVVDTPILPGCLIQ